MTQGLLYQIVAQKIKSDILEGKYPVGSLLPTEIQLEEMFQVSKVTVRKAVQILSDEGYVVKKSGKGTRVISNRLFNKLSKALSYSSILEDSHDLDKELLSFDLVSLDETEEMYQYFGSKAHRLKRIYRLDGKVFIYFEHYFPVVDESESSALKGIAEHSIYRWLSNHGYEVASFKDFFEVERVNQEIQDILSLEEPYVLRRARISKDAEDHYVEVSVGHYNTKVKPYIIDYEI